MVYKYFFCTMYERLLSFFCCTATVCIQSQLATGLHQLQDFQHSSAYRVQMHVRKWKWNIGQAGTRNVRCVGKVIVAAFTSRISIFAPNEIKEIIAISSKREMQWKTCHAPLARPKKKIRISICVAFVRPVRFNGIFSCTKCAHS